MLDEIRDRIEAEIARLTHELTVVLPKVIKIAVEHGDLRENADYKSSLERQQFVQARLGQLTKRMGELSKIDPAAMPHDRVGFGSRVKLFDVVLAEEVSFTVVAGARGRKWWSYFPWASAASRCLSCSLSLSSWASRRKNDGPDPYHR
jgi:transcription elongation factor GreA